MRVKSTSFRIVLLSIFIVLTTVVKAQLIPQFSATPISGCAPLLVNFQDQTTGGAAQWKWDLGSGTISFLQNPSVTYFNPGTYTIKLIVQNASGTLKDSIIKLQYITVFASPVVNFTASQVTGCFPLPVSFTDNSVAGSGTITSWLWDFGDGNSSTVQNPVHTYTAGGSFNVSLIITNSNGCTKTLTKTNYISLVTGVSAAFTNSPATGCTVPQTINFQNQSTGTGTLSYSWSFGDGGVSSTFSPSHTYLTTGNFSVQLIVTNSVGCRDTATHLNTINIGTVQANFIVQAILCAGTAYSFTNTSVPVPLSASWSFGDGTVSAAINPVKTFTLPGNYTIKLVSDFGGCRDSISKNVTVFAKPVSAFTGTPRTSCTAPLTVNFVNSSTGSVSNRWLFGDGGSSSAINPSYTYTAPGVYTVTLISTNASGCTDTLKKAEYIKIIPPVATIDSLPKSGCAPYSWTFSSKITGADPVTNYLWNFGDGTTSTLPNPTHVFAAGIYDIQLIIITAGGCTDTVTVLQGIRSTIKPTANFIATPRNTCAFIAVQFQDLSTGNVTAWSWDFGDNSESTDQNPIHQYSDTGLFTVTLIVHNFGCADTIAFVNYIHIKPPIAGFSVPFNCNSQFTKTFIDQSIGADTWLWNFGDGNTSTLQSPVHTYVSVGVYTVSQTVTNFITGCTHTTSVVVNVTQEKALFTATQTEICKNFAAVFTATTLQPTSFITNYQWDFGDGNTGTGKNISHIYSASGSYNVRLVITDINNCTDTLVKNQYIHVYGPLANFVPSVPGSCVGSVVSFTDQTVTDGIHSIVQWHWYYGDGTNAILGGPPFQHTYNASGIYNVAVVVTDSFGCTDSISKNSILFISAPAANFISGDSVSCPGKSVVFANTSSGPGLTYKWNFGDGNTSTLSAPTHIYAVDGLYTVQLTVTDIYGCANTLSRPQYIKIASPVANFTVNATTSSCPPLLAQFTNTSVNMSSAFWDFGDGNTSVSLNPFHLYNTAGTFISKLTVTSPGGCTSVKTQPIIIEGPRGTFSYGPFSGCIPLTVNFVATTQSRSSFIWDFNDGTTIATTDSVLAYTYNTPGTYTPKMILKDVAGCTVPITGPDTIRAIGAVASFMADTLIRCNNGAVSFTNTSVSNDIITGYLWDFGDGSTSTVISPVHFYSNVGVYIIKLKVTTQSGCITQTISQIPVRVVKSPDITLTQSSNGCVPLTISFTGNLINPDTSAITWLWKFSDGRQFSGQNLSSIIFPSAGNFKDTLIAINTSGCRDSAFNSLDVYPKPIVTTNSNVIICQGIGQTISAQGAFAYVWSPPTGLSCTNCQSPIATPGVATDYIVTGTSQQGCSNSAQVRVDVRFPFRLQPGHNDTLCMGQSKVLTVSGAFSYIWSPATGLNITTGPTVTASPSLTTIYQVVGSDDKNCFKDTAYFPVKVYPIPTVNAGKDTTVNVGQIVKLTPVISSDVTNVVWSPFTGIVSSNFPSVIVRPTMNMEYTVKATNPGGCSSTDAVNIFVLCNGSNVFIPNTFSPNNDGANDVFYVRGTGLFKIKQARIFNRWGEEIFSKYSINANDISVGWDGNYKGQKQPVDVYVYMIEIECENNTTLLYKGNVALIK